MAALHKQPKALDGSMECEIMLHHPGKHPRGAITPARLLFWQPSPSQDRAAMERRNEGPDQVSSMEDDVTVSIGLQTISA